MKRVHGVHCVLMNDGKILLLKRSQLVFDNKGLWAGVAGAIEDGESPEAAALREIKEEVGIGPEQLRLVRAGKVFPRIAKGFDGRDTKFMVHPFLFESGTQEVAIDWEHEGWQWIRLEDVGLYPCTEGFLTALKELGL